MGRGCYWIIILTAPLILPLCSLTLYIPQTYKSYTLSRRVVPQSAPHPATVNIMPGPQHHATSPPPAGHSDPFTDPSYAVPLTPAAPRPPFAQYQSASTLPHAYQHPSSRPSSIPSSPTSPHRSGLNEYIGLPTRLLLASLSPALLPIILTIAHLATNRRSTADMADSLRSSMYAACTGLAQGAGTLQTIPRYMAMQTNEQMVCVTQGMIRATGMGLIHMVTIIETVVIFVINTYRSLLVCTIELAVRGTLELMIGAVRGVSPKSGGRTIQVMRMR